MSHEGWSQGRAGKVFAVANHRSPTDRSPDDGEEEEEDFVLSEAAWAALLGAGRELVSSFEVDLDVIEHGGDFSETAMALAVPGPKHRRYDLGFAQRFAAAAQNLMQRLDQARAAGWPYPCPPLLNCVVDELVMWLLLEEASAVGPGEVPALGEEEADALKDICFEDNDFLLLFDRSADGFLYDSALVDQMRFVNLNFDSWFELFRPGEDPLRTDERGDPG
ncbi:MAG: hypothetical protein ACRDJU_06805 [Actinomycetota bacterium]